MTLEIVVKKEEEKKEDIFELHFFVFWPSGVLPGQFLVLLLRIIPGTSGVRSGGIML